MTKKKCQHHNLKYGTPMEGNAYVTCKDCGGTWSDPCRAISFLRKHFKKEALGCVGQRRVHSRRKHSGRLDLFGKEQRRIDEINYHHSSKDAGYNEAKEEIRERIKERFREGVK